MNSRLRNAYKKIEAQHLDCLVVASSANISYLTGFTSRDSYLLASKKKNVYFTDSRYIEEARIKLKNNAAISKINGSVFKQIAEACLELRLKRIGFEARNLSFAEYKKIKGSLKKGCKLLPATGLIEALRLVKEPAEIREIRKAIKITLKALRFIKKFIRPGRKEIEVVAELERFIRYHGAKTSAFDIIVASGPNSSYPHHISGERRIRNNEPVLVDIGVDYNGYKSDLTRVFFLGKINTLAQDVCRAVLEAQKRAIYSISANVAARKVDSAARNYLTEQGFGKFFLHSLGHGVGLEVHEAPRLSSKEDAVLLPGEVLTVEPAVYLPGRFGIRIEDMVLVKKKGCEVLSGAINK